jgi:N-acyl-D-amino-acid deacylase
MTAAGQGTTLDLLLRGGTVVDGTGAPGRRADVGIVDDRIAAVGDLSQFSAARTIDVSGCVVAPGFIDIHTHSDVSVTFDPGQASAIAMGVTTQITGNCALAMGFARDAEVFAFERRILAIHGARIRWNQFGEHLSHIDDNGVATNYVPLAGHGTLRKRVIGMEHRAATPDEMREMRRELEAAFEAGVWGLSSGLEYPPSSYADVAELADLSRVAADYGGFYATHLRNEGDTLVEAVQEALDVAEAARIPLQLSHHKAEGQENWGKIRTTLGMVDSARARGLDVQLDQYPYTAFMTGLSIQTLPRWALSGTPEEVVERLKDPTIRQSVRAEMLARPGADDSSEEGPWGRMRIGVCRGRAELQGRSIASIAREEHAHPVDVVLDILANTEGYVSAVNFAIGEEDIALVMRHPWTSIGSDGVGTHPGGTAREDRIHPRAYGTFPRVLGNYVRELGVIGLEEAVHKMTALPAARLGLDRRGKIETGWFADIAVFDAATVADRATFDEPHQYAQGIRLVLVNGRVALDQGEPNGSLAGRVLRRA